MIEEIKFNSWREFVQKAEFGEKLGSHINHQSEVHPGDQEWDFGMGFQGSIDAAKSGWKEGAQKIQASLDILNSHIKTKRFKTQVMPAYTQPGVLNIGRYVSGHPKPYMQKKQIEDETGDNKSGKIVNITFNITASAGISSSEMFNKGATIAALVELLERAGKRVELKARLVATDARLVATDGGKPPKSTLRYQVPIKEAGEPIDVDRLAFSLAHPGSFRRLGFSIMEQASEKIQKALGIGEYGFRYGSPGEWQDPEDGIYIGSTSLTGTEASRVEWIRKQLADYGITWED